MKILLKALVVVFLYLLYSHRLTAQSIIVNVINNTNCEVPNGMASATVDGTTVGYSFKWHVGVIITGPIIATQPQASFLRGGNYTVEATQISTGNLIGVKTITVLDDFVYPLVDIDLLSPTTSCAFPNGSLKALVSGNAGDYEFEWYQGFVTLEPPYHSGQILTQVSPGLYSVLITNKVSRCQVIISDVVPDERISPVASIDVLSNLTSCNSPNGSLKAIVVGQATDYSYKWYKGITNLQVVVSTNEILPSLTSGAYSVVVRHLASLCESTISKEILDQRVIPSASVEVLSHETSCSTPNGALQVVVEGNAVDYSFGWYHGTQVSGTVLSAQNILLGVSSGTYSVNVMKKNSGCHIAYNSLIMDKKVIPQLAITVTGNQLALPSIPTYTYQWLLNDAMLSQDGPIITVVENGNYAAKVITAEGCEAVIEPVNFTNAITAIEQQRLPASPFSIYPNPTRGKILIHDLGTSDFYLIVSDQYGKVILSYGAFNSGVPDNVDLTTQPSGVYFLTFVFKNGTKNYSIVKH